MVPSASPVTQPVVPGPVPLDAITPVYVETDTSYWYTVQAGFSPPSQVSAALEYATSPNAAVGGAAAKVAAAAALDSAL